jgi:hypothetical protein
MSIGPEFIVKLGEEGAAKLRGEFLKTETLADQLSTAIVKIEQSTALKKAQLESRAYTEAVKASAAATEALANNFKTTETIADKLAASIKHLNESADLKEAQKSSDSYQAALKRTRESTDEVASSTGSANAGLAGIAGGFLIAANQAIELAQKVAAAGAAIWEFGKAGAKVADLGTSFTALGGKTKDIDALRTALAGTVDDAALIKMSNTARSLGVDVSRLPDLAGIAGKASMALGEDIGFMFDSVVKGSARESALILDNLGIQIKDSAGQLAKVYADMGVEAEKATADQRAAAFATVVTNNAGKLSALDLANSQGAAYAQVEAQLKNFIGQIQVSVAEGLKQAGMFERINEVMSQAQGYFAANKEELQGLAQDGFGMLRDIIPVIVQSAGMAADIFKVMSPFIGALFENLKLVNTPLVLMAGVLAPLIDWLTELKDDLGPVGDALYYIIVPAAAVNDALAYIGEAISPLLTWLGVLSDKLGYFKFILGGAVLPLLVWLYDKIGGVSGAISGLGDICTWIVEKVWDPMIASLGSLIDWLSSLKDKFGIVKDAIDFLLQPAKAMGEAFAWVAEKLGLLEDPIDRATEKTSAFSRILAGTRANAEALGAALEANDKIIKGIAGKTGGTEKGYYTMGGVSSATMNTYGAQMSTTSEESKAWLEEEARKTEEYTVFRTKQIVGNVTDGISESIGRSVFGITDALDKVFVEPFEKSTKKGKSKVNNLIETVGSLIGATFGWATSQGAWNTEASKTEKIIDTIFRAERLSSWSTAWDDTFGPGGNKIEVINEKYTALNGTMYGLGQSFGFTSSQAAIFDVTALAPAVSLGYAWKITKDYVGEVIDKIKEATKATEEERIETAKTVKIVGDSFKQIKGLGSLGDSLLGDEKKSLADKLKKQLDDKGWKDVEVKIRSKLDPYMDLANGLGYAADAIGVAGAAVTDNYQSIIDGLKDNDMSAVASGVNSMVSGIADSITGLTAQLGLSRTEMAVIEAAVHVAAGLGSIAFALALPEASGPMYAAAATHFASAAKWGLIAGIASTASASVSGGTPPSAKSSEPKGSGGSSSSKSSSSNKTKRETQIVQLMVDQRVLGTCAIGGANQAVARGQGARLNSSVVRSTRRSFGGAGG